MKIVFFCYVCIISIMKYLLYMQDGFSKRLPLLKQNLSLGRGNDNDIVVDNIAISRNHLAIEVGVDSILIKDEDSINGSFFKGEKIKKAEIKEGESFLLGELDFTLKISTSKDLEDFDISTRYVPELKKDKNFEIKNSNSKNMNYIKTDQLKDCYGNLLEEFLKIGISTKNFNEALTYLSKALGNLPNIGSLFIISNNANDSLVFFSYKKSDEDFILLKKLIKSKKDLFAKHIKKELLKSEKKAFSVIPFKLKTVQASLIYIYTNGINNNEIEPFIMNLTKEMELLSGLYSNNNKNIIETTKTIGNETNIIAENSLMKTLIKQSVKIANSDIFVLIEGESGTGKELFARLIHNNSKRKDKEFIALNCAAIPENLLESELFGHEKGAFTGAFALKKGKLEIASGGTLVLDEIGDMPYNLQTKLLRALQENEFYRLGGNTPIKVNLRIISITNRNLKDLIEKKEFREDFYYRLVHRSILIPPLRDRKEDIPVLINYFTNRFCKKYNRTISGYTIKAFETLQNYFWRGNIRQLENEIKTIVNLTDDGEMINYDILSNEIKQSENNNINNESQTNVFYQKPDKATIINLLEKHNWNKTKAAKELNMTYRGLHKKLEKLNIKKQ